MIEQTENTQNHNKKLAKKLVVWGIAGVMLLVWLVYTPPGLLGKADAIGFAVCHRINARSFHLDGRPLALCARCSGMYLGALLGLGYQWLTCRRSGKWPPKGQLALFGLMALAFAADGANSYFQYLTGNGLLYQTTNPVRAFVGMGMGLVMAVALYPSFNQTVWRDYEDQPSIKTWKQLAGLLVLAVIVVLLLLSGNPLILYPLSLISAGGVVVMLSMLYSMILLSLTRKENFAEDYRDLAMPLLLGFIIALVQISLLDFGRLILFGSWGGFPNGLGN
jgi:uncharacterized membrane protein